MYVDMNEMSDVPRIANATPNAINQTNDTGWPRLIGSPKLQVIFRKRATNYRALLWKAYEDKGSYADTGTYEDKGSY